MIIRHNLALTHGAAFSDCERYRYHLRRSFTGSVLEKPANPVIFVMLNPSTADALQDDPTIRRCIGFARSWGYSDLLVVNLFAIRETNSKLLKTFDDPVGPENDRVLADIPEGWPVIAAWGSHKLAHKRAEVASKLIRSQLLCLRRSEKTGAPEHPLYLPADLMPKPWAPRSPTTGEVRDA